MDAPAFFLDLAAILLAGRVLAEVATRFGAIIREEIAQTVADCGELEDEIRDILAGIRTS